MEPERTVTVERFPYAPSLHVLVGLRNSRVSNTSFAERRLDVPNRVVKHCSALQAIAKPEEVDQLFSLAASCPAHLTRARADVGAAEFRLGRLARPFVCSVTPIH